MKALVITGTGGPEVLSLQEVPNVQPGDWDVEVRVRATAINRADLIQLRGHYPAPVGVPSDIPGLEYAGEVISIGAHVRSFKPGDRVMGLVGGGAFAERLTVHEREVLRIPEGASFEDAAAIPEAFITAYDALVLQGELRSGELVLIHAAASGVGTAAIQLVHALGATAIGTARSRDKLQRLEGELGLRHAVHVDDPPRFADTVRKLAGDRGVDVALELVGGAYLPETLAAMAPRGRVMLVGLLAGAKAELDLRTVLTRRLRVTGTVLRSRALEEKIAVAQAANRHLIPLFEAKKLRPIIDDVVPMADARRGFEAVASNKTFGKIVLRW